MATFVAIGFLSSAIAEGSIVVWAVASGTGLLVVALLVLGFRATLCIELRGETLTIEGLGIGRRCYNAAHADFSLMTLSLMHHQMQFSGPLALATRNTFDVSGRRIARLRLANGDVVRFGLRDWQNFEPHFAPMPGLDCSATDAS